MQQRPVNFSMLKFLNDYYWYKKSPWYFPIVLVAASMLSFVAFSDGYSLLSVIVFWGVAWWILFTIFGQSTIVQKASRMSCGFSWGTIACICLSHHLNVEPQISFISTIMLYAVACCVIYYLRAAMITIPASVNSVDSESRYVIYLI
jgi:hypothetical protein